jgi:hypothetical protein
MGFLLSPQTEASKQPPWPLCSRGRIAPPAKEAPDLHLTSQIGQLDPLPATTAHPPWTDQEVGERASLTQDLDYSNRKKEQETVTTQIFVIHFL